MQAFNFTVRYRAWAPGRSTMAPMQLLLKDSEVGDVTGLHGLGLEASTI